MANQKPADTDTRTLPLGVALAQLPLEAPDRDAWPMLAARLQAKQRAPRWPLALAASLLLGLLFLPKMATSPTTPVTTVASQPADAAAVRQAQLSALMSESERLERLLYATENAGASSATAAAISAAYEDQLHALDAQLAANRDPARTLPLWQQRVELLRGVAAVETSRRYLASQGGSFDVALVAAY
jgi:hypothetical protein